MRTLANLQSVFLLCGTLAILTAGCEQQDSKKEYLARVGDAYLTHDAMETLVDSTTRASETLTREYVRRWVNDELLYQEARRQGLENTELFRQRLAEARRQLAVEALLQKEVYGTAASIPEDTLRAYFQLHHAEFPLQHDVVRINLAVFNARDKANAFRAKILSGMTWQAALRLTLDDSATSRALLTHTEQQYFNQQTLVPPELWRVAISLLPHEISFPVRSEETYVVIQLLTSLTRGEIAPFDMVQDEIRQRLLIEQRRQHYANLLARLQSQYEIEIVP